MEQVINQEVCQAYDSKGRLQSTTIKIVQQGVSVNGEPVYGWNFVSAPGIIFADRSAKYQPMYPKEPKCPPEFWRRTKRVKPQINVEIYHRRLDMAAIKKQLKILDNLISRKSDAFGDAYCMVRGLIQNQRTYVETMGHPCPYTAKRLKEWERTKKDLQTEYEALQGTRASLQVLYQKYHRECLDIRIKERS